MAEQKIFAGPRIRRIRNGKGLTQTAMAEGLGISPSYLNLIERNQRPLTVQLILKLASVYHVEPEELHGEARGSIAALREVFSDPLLAGELPGDQELVELAEGAPNAAAAVLKLFRAYREQAERLSDLSQLLAHEGRTTALSGARLPIDEVREVFERRPNHFAALEEEGEAFIAMLDPGDDLFGALKAWLKREFGIVVKVLPAATMPNWRRRYDRHSQRLFISERLSPFDQLREVAMEACLMRMSVVVAAEIQSLKLSSDEARRLARFELGRYAAHALMMPYQAFQSAAVRARYDVDVLKSRFGVSFEQAANRLTTLQRPGAAGVPFFMLEVDNAGNRFRRAARMAFRRAVSAAVAQSCRCTPPSPSPARYWSRRRKCRMAPNSCAWRAHWKGRRAPSRSGRAAPPCCWAAISASATRSSMARRCPPARSARRGRARPRRSARPAVCASAPAACREPNRR